MFSLPALMLGFTIVMMNVLKCALKYILKAVEGKALERNQSILIYVWEKRNQMKGKKSECQCHVGNADSQA